MRIGERVNANSGLGSLGLPYRAVIEDIQGEHVKVRPLHPTLTPGSARGRHIRKGPSIRARWVNINTIQPLEEGTVA